MSRVVLRCPHCGTTRADTGECQACHEAQVRYFCTNHAPGRWLDSAACDQCGARFGESAQPPAPARGGRPVSARRSTAPAAPPARGAADPSRGARPVESPVGAERPRRPLPGPAAGMPRPAPPGPSPGRSPGPSPGPFATGRGPAGADRGADGDEPGAGSATGAPTNWRDLLIAVARAQQRRAAAAAAGARERPVVHRRRGGGCLSRVMLLLVMAFFALISTMMFGGSLLRMFVPW